MCIKTIAKIIRETALVLALSAFTVAVIFFFTSGDIIISKAPKSYDANIYEEGLMPLEADLIYYTYKHDIIDERLGAVLREGAVVSKPEGRVDGEGNEQRIEHKKEDASFQDGVLENSRKHEI